MKEKIIAIAILCIIAIGVSANTLMLRQSIAELEDKIDEIDIKSGTSLLDLKEIYEEYKEKKYLLSLTVSHDDLTSVDECFIDAIGYLKSGNIENADVVKSRLKYFLEHLRRLSGLNIDSII